MKLILLEIRSSSLVYSVNSLATLVKKMIEDGAQVAGKSNLTIHNSL